jgi:hypothetical protein
MSIRGMNKFHTLILNCDISNIIGGNSCNYTSNVFASYADSFWNSNTDITFVGSPTNTSSSNTTTNPSPVAAL